MHEFGMSWDEYLDTPYEVLDVMTKFIKERDSEREKSQKKSKRKR